MVQIIQLPPVTLCYHQKYWCSSDLISFWTSPRQLHPIQILNQCLPGNLKVHLLKPYLSYFYVTVLKESWHKSVCFWPTSFGFEDLLFGRSSDRDSVWDLLDHAFPFYETKVQTCEIRSFNYLRKFSGWPAMWARYMGNPKVVLLPSRVLSYTLLNSYGPHCIRTNGFPRLG